jgi:chorismate mutase
VLRDAVRELENDVRRAVEHAMDRFEVKTGLRPSELEVELINVTADDAAAPPFHVVRRVHAVLGEF